MLMSKYNNSALAVLLITLLAACQSGPEPAPEPAPTIEPAPATETAPEIVPEGEATASPEAQPVPQPIDFNQQFYEEAVGLLKRGETEFALELLLQVSSDAPDKPHVFTNLGLTYFKLQKIDLAEQAFLEAITRNDDDAVAHNHLGILMRQKGEFEAARQHYQKALKIDSDYALAHLNLGILYDIYFQDIKPALQHYQRYQTLIDEENSQVAGWIVDIERRLNSGKSGSKG